jgi:hypothetical protein
MGINYGVKWDNYWRKMVKTGRKYRLIILELKTDIKWVRGKGKGERINLPDPGSCNKKN